MRKISFITFGFMVATLVGLVQPAVSANALSGWKAGRIINDSVFTDYNSMSASQIQSFLNGKVTSCDTNGQKLSEFGGPDLNGDGKVQRWEWGKSKYNQTKFVCIKDYVVDGKKASQIIYEKSQKYRISPRVLIVLLQKEQGLITDTWPLNLQYRSATGYGCPDTAPCDSQYYGLANQVDWAAKMFRAIMNDSPDWYTPYNVGTNYIQYNPQASCGGSNVYIENRSTQALYNYTPYQPNKGALDAGWGSATCGAYGNRNFYLYFSSWFGRPNGNPYSTLDEPRWMRLGAQATKYDLVTDTSVDDAFPAGTQFSFRDKIELNGEVYLRTKHDSTNGYQKGIRLTDVEEIPYVPFATPRKMAVPESVNKVYPHSGKSISNQTVSSILTPKFTSKTTVNGVDYYRTESDTNNNIRRALPAATTTEVPFVAFDNPRFMSIPQAIAKVNPVLETTGSTVNADDHVRFDSKAWVDGRWYYRSEADSLAGNQWSIASSAVIDIPYETITTTVMRLNAAVAKRNPKTGSAEQITVESGTRLRFTQKIIVNGVTFYRSQYDESHELDKALPAQYLDTTEPLSYSSMPSTKLRLKSTQRKLDAELLTEVDKSIKSGSVLTFSSRVTVDGAVYYRTTYDTSHALNKVIPASGLTTP